jgi:molybdenum-dependent DNA-binding transcriptional regulator ModE
VTKRGLDLMKRYEAFEAECTEFVKNAFDRYFT